MNDELLYLTPADAFEQALPLGNGRIGAMVYGKTTVEKVSLNEDTLWSGYPRFYSNPGAQASFRKAQSLIQDSRYDEAEEELEQNFSAYWTQSYLPLANLWMEFGHDTPMNYRRGLELTSGVATVAYRKDGVTYNREYFISHPDQCFAVKLTCSHKGALSFEIKLTSMLKHRISHAGNHLILDGICPSNILYHYDKNDCELEYSKDPEEKGIPFRQILSIEAPGGKIAGSSGRISVQAADSAVIYLCIGTGFSDFATPPCANGTEFEKRCMRQIELCMQSDYCSIRSRHIQDFRSLMGRCSLHLAASGSRTPTDVRLKHFNGSELGLYELLFNFGKYLMISSSRPGTQAANLQGIWNELLPAPWNSNYTVNINSEMNYWPVHAMIAFSSCFI